MYLSPPRIETERLILRKLTLADAPEYFAHLWGDPAIAQYMLWEPHQTMDESIASIQKALDRYDRGESCRWAVVRKEDQVLIGIVELLGFQEETGGCSFAYMLGRKFQSRGYGTEALAAAFDYAFRTLQIGCIVADHFAENPASGAVMRKVGMQYVRTIPEKYEKHGRRFDASEYKITRQMWLQEHSV